MKHLLPPVEKYFKANLHTHSTVSDGKLTPEEVRNAYKAAGYSILALTDHSVIVEHQHLNQEDFLMLTGVEVDVDDRDDPKGDIRNRQCHLCLISKDPKHLWIPFRDPNPIPCSVPYEALDEIGGLSREYSPENINRIIAECNRQGYLVTYNHPCWSLETYQEYGSLKGLWAMEYRNGGSVAIGFDENNGRVYQDLLTQGNRLVPVCADDTHSPLHRSNSYPVLGDSWNMIGAEKLEYDSVIAAMERGDLYASCGPEIHSLTWEDNTVKITCSEAAHIKLITHTRHAQMAFAEKGTHLTEAQFDMTRWMKANQGSENAFLRLIVTAADGTYAVTRAYWMDELKG